MSEMRLPPGDCKLCLGTGLGPQRRRTVTGADGRHGTFYEDTKCPQCRGNGSASPARVAEYRREVERQERQRRLRSAKDTTEGFLLLLLLGAIVGGVVYCWQTWPHVTPTALFLALGIGGVVRAFRSSSTAAGVIQFVLGGFFLICGVSYLVDAIRYASKVGH